MCNSPGLADFTVGPVNSVFYLPDKPMKVLEKISEENVTEVRVLLDVTFRGASDGDFWASTYTFSYCLPKESLCCRWKLNPVINHLQIIAQILTG